MQRGEVRAEPASDSVSGPKMGADAIVIVDDRMEVPGTIRVGPWYERSVPQTLGRVVVGVAIKYTGAAGSGLK